MSIRRRIRQVERLVPDVNKTNDKEVEQVTEWLVDNSEEFKECVRQLFRLQCKTEGGIANLDELEQHHRQKAESYMIRIKQLIDQHRGSVTA